MKGTVNVKLRTVNDYGDGNGKDTLDKEYTGEARYLAGKQIIRYSDEEVNCTVKLDENKVTIMRRVSGAGTSMVLERGVLHNTEYTTAYGNMDLSVDTKKLIVKDNGESICIEARYEAYLSGQLVSVNDMHMVVRLTKEG